jgi:hypothetical protein
MWQKMTYRVRHKSVDTPFLVHNSLNLGRGDLHLVAFDIPHAIWHMLLYIKPIW